MIREVLERVQQIAAQHTSPPRLFHVGSRKILFNKFFFSSILAQDQPRGTLSFVDGGNAEIIRAPHLSVHFIRTYAAVYLGMQRVSRQTREAFAIIHLKQKGDKLAYAVELLGAELDIPEIEINDPTLSTGEQVSPHAVADVVRHCLEWQLIELQDAGCVIRDGALDECPQDRYRKVKDSTVMQIGVSKTTTALTDTGVSAPFFLSQQGREGAWVYDPKHDKSPFIGFALLHPLSKRVFRIDVKNGTLPEAANILAPYCADASFVGYPYGLVDADRMAVITMQEQQYLRQLFLAKSGKLFEELEQAADAHDVLNRMH